MDYYSLAFQEYKIVDYKDIEVDNYTLGDMLDNVVEYLEMEFAQIFYHFHHTWP